jgi:F0F1-type ATP synthase assembly protein I
MPEDLIQESRRLWGYAFVGFEMVAPILAGIWVDRHWDCSPWGVGIGAVAGLIGGIGHLSMIAAQQNRIKAEAKKARPRREDSEPPPEELF